VLCSCRAIVGVAVGHRREPWNPCRLGLGPGADERKNYGETATIYNLDVMVD